MEFQGYGARARLTDGVLTIEASSAATKIALGSASRAIPVAEISAIQLKRPTLLGNGQISIQSEVGVTLIHFLKKALPDAEALHAALQAASSAPREAVPSGRLANEKRDAWGERLAARQAQDAVRMAELKKQQRENFEAWKVANSAIAAEAREAVAAAKSRNALAYAQMQSKVSEAQPAPEVQLVSDVADGEHPQPAAKPSAQLRDGFADLKSHWRQAKQDANDELRDGLSQVKTEWGNGISEANAQLGDALRAIPVVSALLDAAELETIADPDRSDLLENAAARPTNEVVDDLLNLAETAGRAGDILLEERYIVDASEYARRHGDRKDRKYANNEILRRDIQGELRVASDRIGVVEAESTLTQWTRKQSLLAVSGSSTKSVEVRSDRIIAGGITRVIDEHTSAQVYVDGQTQVIQRPTLTRMALLSPLPGSAIIAGMALQKKTTVDTRTAEFQIGSVGWQLRITIAPGAVNGARAIAESVNRLASSLEKEREQALVASSDPTANALTQLERLSYLVERAVLDTDEASRLRSAILAAL